jgi:hypothetical protein
MTELCALCGKNTGELVEVQDGFALATVHEICVLKRDNLRLEQRCEELEEANKRLMSKLYR